MWIIFCLFILCSYIICEENDTNNSVKTITKLIQGRNPKQMVFYQPPNLTNQKQYGNNYAVNNRNYQDNRPKLNENRRQVVYASGVRNQFSPGRYKGSSQGYYNGNYQNYGYRSRYPYQTKKPTRRTTTRNTITEKKIKKKFKPSFIMV